MAAYGLYTHIQSNRVRSVLLLIGLFVLVFVLTYAGALTAEAWMYGGANLQWYLTQAWRDTVMSSPFVVIGTAVWLFVAYNFHQSMIDAITGGHEVTPAGTAAAL